jgi:hypothetical protein
MSLVVKLALPVCLFARLAFSHSVLSFAKVLVFWVFSSFWVSFGSSPDLRFFVGLL